mgnify:FL=1
MSIPIRVLIVEDSDDDTILLVRELKRNGFNVLYEQVDNYKDMKTSLGKREWDIVLCDYSMPKFDGLSAMELLHEEKHELPFILLSDTIGEAVAVKAMKAGADDYIMKDNLSRLATAVTRELNEYRERQELKRINNTIQTLVKSTVIKTGENAFRKIISSVKEWLDTNFVCLGQIIDDDRATVLSMINNEDSQCDCIYNIQGTLCEIVIKEGFCHYPEGAANLLPVSCKQCTKVDAVGFFGMSIQDEYGKCIGLLWTVSSKKLTLPPRAMEVLEIIVTKAGSEIERMWVEEQLHKLSHAVEQSSSIVIITDIKGTIEYVNHMFTKLTGYPFGDVIGQSPSIIKSGKTSDDEYRQLWKTIMDGKEWHGEFCNKKKNGELYWGTTSISPVRNKDGKITSFKSIMEDITERKEMEETIRLHNEKLETLIEERTTRIMELERQRMENEKLAASGRMAATVAHEINNPLSSIKGGFMLIKNSVPEDHKYYDYVGIIEKEIDRITRIVKQMFNLSKPYQGEICEFDVISVMRDVVIMLDKLWSEHRVFINFDGHDDTVKVTMSEDYFRQVLLNIIKNAIEASCENGRIEIKVRINSRLNIAVSDLGEGMSHEVHSKIFEPFFSTKSKYSDSGLGLGLATTKVIVESMGGSIDCISEKGKGTVFTIDLPIHIVKQ